MPGPVPRARCRCLRWAMHLAGLPSSGCERFRTMMHRPGGGRHGTRAVRERQMTRHRSHRAGDQPPLAITNGATRIALIEMITHLAFYTGGPIPVSAIKRVRELLPEIA